MICPLVLFRYRVSASRHFGHSVIHDRVKRVRNGSRGKKKVFFQVLLVFLLVPSTYVNKK